MAKLYQYAVIRTKPVAKIVVNVTPIIAESEVEVRMIAARAIPAEDTTTFEGVEILIRGF